MILIWNRRWFKWMNTELQDQSQRWHTLGKDGTDWLSRMLPYGFPVELQSETVDPGFRDTVNPFLTCGYGSLLTINSIGDNNQSFYREYNGEWLYTRGSGYPQSYNCHSLRSPSRVVIVFSKKWLNRKFMVACTIEMPFHNCHSCHNCQQQRHQHTHTQNCVCSTKTTYH